MPRRQASACAEDLFFKKGVGVSGSGELISRGYLRRELLVSNRLNKDAGAVPQPECWRGVIHD